MATQYPKEMKSQAKAPGVKKTFVSDIQPTNPHDCRNCGGAGTMSLFCAMEGPYQSPDTVRKTVMGFNDEGAPIQRGMTSHFDFDINSWWTGVLYTFECPVCHGVGRIKTTLQEAPGWVKEPHLAEVFEQK